MQMFDVVQSILLTGTAVAGACIAGMGLFTWRQQLRGRTEYDVSRRLLLAAYRLRDEMANFRASIITGGEIEAAAKEAQLDPKGLNMAGEKAIAAVRWLRWKHLREALTVLNADELEAEVLWGREVKDAMSPIHQCVVALHRASIEADMRSDDLSPTKEDRLRMVELRRTLYGSGGDQDEFARKVEDAVASVETFLRPRLNLQLPKIRRRKS